jgi:hypothetical protein
MHPRPSQHLWGAAALLLITALPAHAKQQMLEFDVFLNDKPIGEHSFEITADERASIERVSSRAEFDVDFLFINAYRYRHSSNEVFRDGCLAQIRATTDDNGERYRVEGTASGEAFKIRRSDGTEQADGCVMTFAYWRQDFLRQQRLLNPQTGELENVRVRREGSDRIEVAGRELPAVRYGLSAEGLDIDLWYNDELGWVGLASDVGNGRRLVYRRTSL